MKHYHASPYRHKKGEIIGRHGMPVFMTSEANPHYTIRDRAIAENWYVYEVKPLGKVYLGKCWDEEIAIQAEIIKCEGQARGIASNNKKHFREKTNLNGTPGSRVFWKYYAHTVSGKRNVRR